MTDATRNPTDGAARVPSDDARSVTPNFVTEVIDRDLREGRVEAVVTRFPPEPNGYLHIGHAKAICLDFGIARDYDGRVHLRMDDTNPTTEDPAFVAAIERDVRWLGFAWDDLRYASDYFESLYALAERLIEHGDAYVDARDEATIRATRGSVSEPGTPSPDRDRGPAENLDLFRRMRAGEFADGSHVLRAKIDLASPNMILRDPVLYRIKHAHHYRTGDAWCVYPLYDFAHPLSDAIEGITHSLCTLEFDNNRAIYDWLVERLFPEPRPRQYEFARLVVDRTVLSKRKLIALVREGHVEGWDDPRMPTLAGIRRRGVPPEAIRTFVDRVGVTKANSRTDPALLDHAVRDALNTTAPRVMAVLDPVELLLEDPDGELDGIDGVDAPSFPDDVIGLVPEAADASRLLPLGRRLWIERDDVALDPPAGFRRMAPGRAVRLRHGVVVLCEGVDVDAEGRVTRAQARVLPGTLGRNPDGVKVWAAIHWLDADTALPAEFRVFGDLFTVADPDAAGDFRQHLDPASLVVHRGFVEPSVAADAADTRYQFERQGYFWRDPGPELGPEAAATDPSGSLVPSGLVWNRIVTLKDARRVTAGGGERSPAPARARPAARAPAAEAAGGEPAGGAAGTGGTPDPLAGLAPADRAAAERWIEGGVDPVHAGLIAAEPLLAGLLADAVGAGADVAVAAPWVAQETRGELRRRGQLPAQLTGEALAELLALLADGTLHAGGAREAWAAVAAGEGSPRAVVERRGLARLDDEAALLAAARAAVAAHPAEAAAFRGGKQALVGFFVGQVMRATGGRADPRAAQAAVRAALAEG
ncbi:MAG: glutamine--tRNA ligase/YqeY domain fusion protein [Trueperaceae bacterium]